jgi:hypothetical protein
MHFNQLNRGELIATVGGIVVGISLALPWYSLGNQFAMLNSCRGPQQSCTGWASLTILRFLLLTSAVAPAVLAYIIVRGHALSWPRGELTAIIALAALTFLLFRGVLDKPGQPRGEITITYGWWIGLAGALLILFGAVFRSQESAARRKPPGVL